MYIFCKCMLRSSSFSNWTSDWLSARKKRLLWDEAQCYYKVCGFWWNDIPPAKPLAPGWDQSSFSTFSLVCDSHRSDSRTCFCSDLWIHLSQASDPISVVTGLGSPEDCWPWTWRRNLSSQQDADCQNLLLLDTCCELLHQHEAL